MRWLYACRSPGTFYFRVFGWGLWFGSYAVHRPLFSERYGYARVLRVGGWRVRVLRPFRRSWDVFTCRYCGRKVDFLVPYHSDGRGLWHWECGPWTSRG